MDFAKALTYPFDDDDWLPKLGIAAGVLFGGALLSFLLLIPLILAVLIMAGWRYGIIVNVKNGSATPLPNIADDFGGFLRRGAPLVGAYIIYQLPILLIVCLLTVATFATGGLASTDGAEALAGLLPIIFACCSCIMVLYAIAAWVVYFGGLIRYTSREEFNTFFQIGDNIAIVRENIGDFGQAVLFLIIGSLIGSVLGSVIPIIGTLLGQIFAYYFGGHILGQLAAKVEGTTGEPVPAV